MTKEPAKRSKPATAPEPACSIPRRSRPSSQARHGDPFAVLGPQEAGGKLVARAFVDGAAELEAFTLDDKPAGTLTRRHDAGFFEGPLKSASASRSSTAPRNAGGEWWVADPYSFGPVLGPDGRLLHPRRHATCGSSTRWART